LGFIITYKHLNIFMKFICPQGRFVHFVIIHTIVTMCWNHKTMSNNDINTYKRNHWVLASLIPEGK
jgi:hypothetical protein